MSSVLLDISGGVAFVMLNRPEKINAFNRDMSLSLQRVLDECRDDERVRAICISGKGKGFSAGQDLSEAASAESPSISKILSEQLNPIITRIRNLPKPVLAAVHGVAAGAGANVALCCDIVVASSSAFFIQAFSKIGLIPDSGGTYFLPRLVGWQKAAALMMLAEKVSAEEAEKMGMIYKHFADASFEGAYKNISTMLAQMPTKALALTKEALNHSVHSNLDDQLSFEDKLQTIAGRTRDFMEGLTAFNEKRAPVFRGL